jgi:dihydrofolate reductase
MSEMKTNKPVLSLLVAADENNLIGNQNKLPWHLPDDLKYFKNLTWAMPVIMGRKTFESVGKVLPGRQNIIITRNPEWKYPGADVVHTIEDAIDLAEKRSVLEIFIIGGAEIFKTSMDSADRIYMTRIHHVFDGDVYFPEISIDKWELIKEVFREKDEKNLYDHSFQVWEKRVI